MPPRYFELSAPVWRQSKVVNKDIGKPTMYINTLKGLSHEIDFENFDQKLKNLA